MIARNGSAYRARGLEYRKELAGFGPLFLLHKNDPFYVGTKGDTTKAAWFADIWQRFGYTSGVHLRRVHYQLVSQDPPILEPNGKAWRQNQLRPAVILSPRD